MIKIKTLIELFDECQIENIITGLKYRPEKIIFVGFKNVMSKSKTEAVERFFALKNINIEFEYEIVGRYDYQSMVRRLEWIIERNEDCCFDLTGGKELILTAMGEVSAKYNIPMIQISIKDGKTIPVKNFDEFIKSFGISSSIEECIALNGGAIVHNGLDYNWQLTDEFINDIQLIWDICRKDCRLWNRQSNILSMLAKASVQDDDYSSYVNLKMNRDIISAIDKDLIEELKSKKLLTKFEVVDGVLRYKFKNNQVKEAIKKAGNILELYIYHIMKKIIEPSCYDDVDVGVIIDWDGIIHHTSDKIKDTTNEVDIMAVKDLVPIFISCKNGEVHKEALYELNSVADRFGGDYSKKILFTTYLSPDDNSRKYTLQRAKDMNIEIIEGVDKLTLEELVSVIKNKVK